MHTAGLSAQHWHMHGAAAKVSKWQVKHPYHTAIAQNLAVILTELLHSGNGDSTHQGNEKRGIARQYMHAAMRLFHEIRELLPHCGSSFCIAHRSSRAKT